ncbi:MAG: hypothetical protein ACSLE3_06955 [Microbacteriaceae bacterium]
MAEGKPGWGEERSFTVRWNDPAMAEVIDRIADRHPTVELPAQSDLNLKA